MLFQFKNFNKNLLLKIIIYFSGIFLIIYTIVLRIGGIEEQKKLLLLFFKKKQENKKNNMDLISKLTPKKIKRIDINKDIIDKHCCNNFAKLCVDENNIFCCLKNLKKEDEQIGKVLVVHKHNSKNQSINTTEEFRKLYILKTIQNKTKKRYEIDNEIKIGKLLANHENIVTCSTFFEDNLRDYCYLLIDYIEDSKDFYVLLEEHDKNKKQIPENLLKLYFYQIATVLNYIHSKNIYHLDIKPENILLIEKKNQIKIIDWGFAAILNNKDEKISIYSGTIPYVPSQILKGEPYLPQYSDCYSFGITLFVMATSHFPFKGNTEYEIRYNVINRNFCLDTSLMNNITMSNELSDLIHNLIYPIEPISRLTMDKVLLDKWFF